MTERKWTQGPWFLSQKLKDGPVYITQKICGVGRIAKVWMGRSGSEANAHLIAAAPDLYEALEELLDRYVSLANRWGAGFWDPEAETEVIAARAALSKARGEVK